MFERQSKEQILDKMIKWSRAVSPKLTDFRRGSVIRTFYEAVAGVIEGLYDSVFRSIKQLIESNLYAVIGFDKIQAVPSSGVVTFSKEEPATDNILIPAGTEIVAEPNIYRPPLVFYTVEDATIPVSYTSVDVEVVCAETGSITCVEANTIVSFASKPFGVDSVTNNLAFTNGEDDETSEDQKLRFQDYMESTTRGTLQAIEYGAKQAYLVDDKGNITEQVLQVIALEDLVNKLSQVDLYVWNGVNAPSEELKSLIQTILKGYTDANGTRVYGYKLAGTIVNIYPANTSYVKIKLTLTTESWAVDTDVKKAIERELKTFFYRLRLGQTVLYSELNALAKRVEGVYDVKVELSTDNGITYNTNNIAVDEKTIVVNNEIIYE